LWYQRKKYTFWRIRPILDKAQPSDVVVEVVGRMEQMLEQLSAPRAFDRVIAAASRTYACWCALLQAVCNHHVVLASRAYLSMGSELQTHLATFQSKLASSEGISILQRLDLKEMASKQKQIREKGTSFASKIYSDISPGRLKALVQRIEKFHEDVSRIRPNSLTGLQAVAIAREELGENERHQSPTLHLAALLAARDMGFLPVEEHAELKQQVLDTFSSSTGFLSSSVARSPKAPSRIGGNGGDNGDMRISSSIVDTLQPAVATPQLYAPANSLPGVTLLWMAHTESAEATSSWSKIDAIASSLRSQSEQINLMGTSAHLPNINIDDEEVRKQWSYSHTVLSEFRKAAECIDVEDVWMTNTMLLRQIRDAGKIFGEDLKRLNDHTAFEKVLLAAIQKGYKLENVEKARHQKDILSRQNVFGRVKGVYNTLEAWKKPYMAHAFQLLVDMENDTAAITTKLSEVVDRSLHCRQVQVKSFNLMISHAYRLVLHQGKPTGDGAGHANGFDAALLRFYECMEDYMDDHKENAFKSSFQEPAKFYFHYRSGSEGWNEDNVETHANNWYLTLLNATLSVHLPLLPAYWDNWPECCCDFWAGLSDDCWRVFSQQDHFGMSYNGITELRRGKAFLEDPRVSRAQFPRGHRPPPPKQWANNIVDPNGNKKHRENLAIYLERFAHFFSVDFFVRKSFNKLNSEEKPEHAGFRIAAEALYSAFRLEQGCSQESFLEYSFDDDMYMDLNVPHICRFYVWLGILKPAAGRHTRPATNTDVNLDHEREPRKDLDATSSAEDSIIELDKNESDHSATLQRITSQLQEAMKQRNVKAIRELMSERNELQQRYNEQRNHRAVTPEEESSTNLSKSFVPPPREVVEFIDTFISVLSHAENGDAHTRAAVFERWQMFEMEFDSQPGVVHRAAQLVVEDSRFQMLLGANYDYLRDASGILFRFCGMYRDKELNIIEDLGDRLEQVIEDVLQPFEKANPVSINGAHIGALYTQAVLPWLCAMRLSGMGATQKHEAMDALTKRVGQAAVHWFKARGSKSSDKRDVKTRIEASYLHATHCAVWGSKEKDEVWATFFA
jgi:hypothetical protein